MHFKLKNLKFANIFIVTFHVIDAFHKAEIFTPLFSKMCLKDFQSLFT